MGHRMTESERPIFNFSGDDAEMQKAIATARQTFKYFWRELAWEHRRIVPGLDMAAVKATFSDPADIRAQNPDALDAEQMWLIDVTFDGLRIQGTLINSPHTLKSYSQGDHVTISGKQLCDWMYVIAGYVYGGFTVDALRSKMSANERKAHDKAWGFHFSDVGNVYLVPPHFIGDPERKRRGIFSLFGKTESPPQNFEKVAVTEHPMSVNMRQSLEKALAESQEMLYSADDDGFTLLHQLSLAGSLDGVDICLKYGADANAAASNGMTPYALAKCLRWKRVMQRLERAGATE